MRENINDINLLAFDVEHINPKGKNKGFDSYVRVSVIPQYPLHNANFNYYNFFCPFTGLNYIMKIPSDYISNEICGETFEYGYYNILTESWKRVINNIIKKFLIEMYSYKEEWFLKYGLRCSWDTICKKTNLYITMKSTDKIKYILEHKERLVRHNMVYAHKLLINTVKECLSDMNLSATKYDKLRRLSQKLYLHSENVFEEINDIFIELLKHKK